MYSDLGVAQADLVQAGLLRNPVFDAAVHFHLGPVRPDLQLGVVFGVLDALYVPLRKRVAAAQFEETKLRVTGAVLDFVLEVRQRLLRAPGERADAGAAADRRGGARVPRSKRAGGCTRPATSRTSTWRAIARRSARSKLELRSAEVAARQSRERLNGLMGLSGTDTSGRSSNGCPTFQPNRCRWTTSSGVRWRGASTSATPGSASSPPGSGSATTARRP